MIVKANNTLHVAIIQYLREEPDFNLFMIEDIERYGYNNYFMTVWVDINEAGNVRGVLLKYFEFLIFYAKDEFDESGFINLIDRIEYVEISGKSNLLDKLAYRLNLKKERRVNFCRLTNSEKLESTEINVKIKKIRFGNINKVVRLYEAIEEFEDTNSENIKNGLKTGRGYCIEINRKVVSMVKSTYENNTHAMIVGVATHPKYRNRGFATKCITKICKELIKENKIPCLFYDNISAGKIYKELGFEDLGEWSIYSR